MSQINSDLVVDKLCDSILDLSGSVQSVCVINKYGRAVKKKARDGIAKQIPEEKSVSLFLQSALEIAMKKDYDNEFGPISYTFSERENLSMFSFPVDDLLILVTSNKDNSPISLASKIVDAINHYRESLNGYLLNK